MTRPRRLLALLQTPAYYRGAPCKLTGRPFSRLLPSAAKRPLNRKKPQPRLDTAEAETAWNSLPCILLHAKFPIPLGNVTADPPRMLPTFLTIVSLSHHSNASTFLPRGCMMLFRQTSRSRRPKSCTPNQLTRPRNVTKTIRQILLLPLLPTSQQS